MPIVLAETLMGLDLLKLNRADSFSGCPALLQVNSVYLLGLSFLMLELCPVTDLCANHV